MKSRSAEAMERDARDRALVTDYCSGNREALGALAGVYVDRVRAVLFRVLGPRRDLDDLVQTVFLEVLKSIEAYRGESAFRTWLDRVTAHVALRAMRKRPPPPPLVLVEDDGVPSGPDDRLSRRRLATHLECAVRALEPGRRLALVLVCVEGRDPAEVAATLDLSAEGLKTRLRRARADLLEMARRDGVLREALEEMGR